MFSYSQSKLQKFASTPSSQISAVSVLTKPAFRATRTYVNYLKDSNIDESIDLSWLDW
jgi:hypothetical protein